MREPFVLNTPPGSSSVSGRLILILYREVSTIDSVTILFVRHGEASSNTDRVFSGATDSKLSDKGRRQLACLSRRFEDIPYSAIYSSPLSRAYETAQAVNLSAGLPIITDRRLMELNGGSWEGKCWAYLPQLYPEQARLWQHNPAEFSPDGGESMRELFARVRDFALSMAERHTGETIVACSHGIAIRNLVCWAKGLPIERLNEIEWCENTAITTIRVSGGSPELISAGDAEHLSLEQKTLANQSWWKQESRGSKDYFS